MWTLIWMYSVRAVPEGEGDLDFACIIPPQSQHCSLPWTWGILHREETVGLYPVLCHPGSSHSRYTVEPSLEMVKDCQDWTTWGEWESAETRFRITVWWWFCVLLVPTYHRRSWSIALHYRKRGGWAALLNPLASLLSPMLFLKPSQSAFVIIYVQEEHMAQPSCWALTLPNPRLLLNPFLGQTPGTAGRWTEKGTSGLPRPGDHTVNPSVFQANPPQYPSRGGKLVFTHIWRAQTCLFPAQFVE